MEALVAVLILLVLAWWVSRRLRRRAETAVGRLDTSSRGRPSEETTLPPARPAPGRPVAVSTDGRVAVVGESHYQPALRAAANGRATGSAFEEALEATAWLVPEPSNPHDRDAVRVDIAGRTVGYLARELATRYQPVLLQLADRGEMATCPARIMGGGSRFYGVHLHLAAPDRLLFSNDQTDGSRLQGDCTVAVTGEEQHQDVLAAYTGRREDGASVPVIAALGFGEITKGKRAGERVIEVSVDGRRVGQLTAMMSERYGALVEDLITRGESPTCEALVKPGARGLQVEVRLPQMR